MRDGSLWVLSQSFSLVYIVVAVTGYKEARKKGTQDERHQNTCYKQSVVNTVVGLVNFRRTTDS